MKTVEIINNYIQTIPKGQPFTIASLRKFGSSENVRQVLSRLAKAKIITRLTRGLYVRPEKLLYLGDVLPEATKVVEVIAKSSGEKTTVHGAEAAHLLHLSTQVPMRPIFYTTGTTRNIKIGNQEITLKHVSPKKIIGIGTPLNLVFSALQYLGKENVSNETIEKIRRQLASEQFSSLYENMTSMPAWMANAFYHYKKEHKYDG